MAGTDSVIPHRGRGRRATAAALVLSLLLSSCVVVPVTREVVDPNCRTVTREVALAAAYVGGFQRCGGEDCAALLAALGVVAVASAVVSGSIALVGNVVYWFERQGRCPGVPPPP